MYYHRVFAGQILGVAWQGDSDSGLPRRLWSKCWRSLSLWGGALGLKEMFPRPVMFASRSELLRTWWREASFPCHLCIFVKLLTTRWFSSPRARQGCLWEGRREGGRDGRGGGERKIKSQWLFWRELLLFFLLLTSSICPVPLSQLVNQYWYIFIN